MVLGRLENESNVVEPCGVESQAGLAGEVAVVLSLASEATLSGSKALYHKSGISSWHSSGVSQQWEGS